VNVVHLSTRRGLEHALAARERGQKVYLETCPQYLLLDESCYSLPGFESAKYVFSPPARPLEDQQALWQALERGDIDTLGTDHCSFDFHGVKELGKDDFSKIPNGLPGWSIAPPCSIPTLWPRGALRPQTWPGCWRKIPPGSSACTPKRGPGGGQRCRYCNFLIKIIPVVLQVQHHIRTWTTPLEGWALRGRADTVLLSGQVAVEGGRVSWSGRPLRPPGARGLLAMRAAATVGRC
jgi:dihydropyrimidinase